MGSEALCNPLLKTPGFGVTTDRWSQHEGSGASPENVVPSSLVLYKHFLRRKT